MFNFNTYLDLPIILFTIEGNIGAGKTTLINYIKQNMIFPKNYIIYFADEPIKIWTEQYDEDGEITTPLKCQYKNPEKCFFPFQVRVLESYFDTYYKILLDIKNKYDLENYNGIIIISDRSPFTMKKVFYDGFCFSRGKNYNWMYDDYNNMYNRYFGNFFTNYFIIYVNTSIEQCYENKNGRNRSGEEIISKNMLEVLDFYTLKYINECIKNKINIKYYSHFNENNNIEEIFTFITNNIKTDYDI